MIVNLTMYVRIRVHDKDGRLLYDHEEESRSFVKAFLAGLLANMQGMTGTTITHDDIGDTSRNIEASNGNGLMMFNAGGAATDDTEGIVIGTSATAVDITDNKLVARIAEGTGAGQMNYALQTYANDITISDPDATFLTSRVFTNNSGSSITVRETGIYCNMQVANIDEDFCMVRDVPTEVVVVDGSTATVDYTFKITE